MRRVFCAALVAFGLAACGNNPPVPDWQMNARGALERAQEAYLSGDSRIEGVEFARARTEVARTGRADLLARLELARCATRVASLVLEVCAGFEALRADAAPPERAYAAYLAGQAGAPAGVALLPEQHRPFAGGTMPVAQRLQEVADPLARWWPPGCCCRPGAPTRPSSRWPPRPPRHRAGVGRCWPGWACRRSGPRPPETVPRPNASAAAWRW
jgi:hypothetical protein